MYYKQQQENEKSDCLLSNSKNHFINTTTTIKDYGSLDHHHHQKKKTKDKAIHIDSILKWAPEEEQSVLSIIDTKLMSFVILMSFVLNMDRTNLCK